MGPPFSKIRAKHRCSGRLKRLLDLLVTFQEQIYFLRRFPGEIEIRRQASQVSRAGMQAQQVQTDRLERGYRFLQSPLHEIALGSQVRHHAVTALLDLRIDLPRQPSALPRTL